MQENIEAQNIVFIIFYNGSNYDYHFIIKESANEFQGKFECVGENTIL